MRVILTGAGGFIGRAIYMYLVTNTQWEVICIDQTPPNADQQCAQYYTCNLTDEAMTRTICRQIVSADVIIHAAAKISFDDFDCSLLQANMVGLLNCLNMARILECKQFIFLSSVPIIGFTQRVPINEDNNIPHPPSLYHLTKWMGEELLQLPCFKDLNSCILRLPAPIAPLMPPHRMIPLFMAQALKNQSITLHGRGGRVQTYVDVRDVAQAVYLATASAATGCYIVDGYSKSNLEVAQLCKELSHSKSEIIFSGVEDPDEQQAWILDGRKIRDELGFTPQIPFEQTLNEMMNYLVKQQKRL